MCDAYWFGVKTVHNEISKAQRDTPSCSSPARSLQVAGQQLPSMWRCSCNLQREQKTEEGVTVPYCSWTSSMYILIIFDYHDCCMHVLPNWKGVRKGSTAELLVCPVFRETANYRNISLCAYTASQHSTNQQNGCGMPQHHSSKQWQNLSSTALSDCKDAKASSCTMLWGKGCYHLKATNGHHKVARPSSGGRFVNDWRNISLDTHSKKWNGWWSGNFPVKPKLQNDPVLTFPSIINQPSIKPTAWVRSKSRNPGPRQFETNHDKPSSIIFLVVHLMNSEFPWNIYRNIRH